MKTWWTSAGSIAWTLAFGIVIGLLAAGVLYLVSSQPIGKPISLSPPPSPLPLSVHISGAVAYPGVYTFSKNSRVQDAIDAAGDFLPEAETTNLNLAAPLQDGESIQVPYKPTSQAILNPSYPESSTKPEVISATPVSNRLININTAPLEELDSLPGIGPIKAQNIIDHRKANGPFSTTEDIQDVNGIGPVTFDGIKDLITVETP